MISLTRLNGQAIAVNEANILWVEALPDTSIMLLSGERLLVQESVQDVCQRVNRVGQADPSGTGSSPAPNQPATGCADAPVHPGSAEQGAAGARKR